MAADLADRSWPLIVIPVTFYEDTAAMGAGQMMPCETGAAVKAFEAPTKGRVVGLIANSEASADIDLLVHIGGSPVAATAYTVSGATGYIWYEDSVVSCTFGQGDAIAVETDAADTAKDLQVILLVELDLRSRV